MNFIIAMLAMILFMVIGTYLFISRIFSFYGVKGKGKNTVILRVAITMIILLVFYYWNFFGIFLMHFIVVFFLLELVKYIILKFIKMNKKRKTYKTLRRIYNSGILVIVIVFIILGYGFYNMNHIQKTEYDISSNKLDTNYKMALITDVHYDTIQNTSILKDKVEEINELDLDFVVLGGDIVEENTSKESMEEAFEVLGNIESKYGIYYIYGNHDRQTYAMGKSSYTSEELTHAIESNGIIILNDEYVEINNDIVLVGREDTSNSEERSSLEDLITNIDESYFIIVADHQPIDADSNEKLGVDLGLSGHTHGGQIFPIGVFLKTIGTLNYGEYQTGNGKIIVSSGIAGWGFPVRTDGICEYVVVNLNREK